MDPAVPWMGMEQIWLAMLQVDTAPLSQLHHCYGAVPGSSSL